MNKQLKTFIVISIVVIISMILFQYGLSVIEEMSWYCDNNCFIIIGNK